MSNTTVTHNTSLDLKIFYNGLPRGLFPRDRHCGVQDEDNNLETAKTPEGQEIQAETPNTFNLLKVKGDRSIHLPLVVDTEFTTSSEDKLQQTPRSHISSQVRQINEDIGTLYFHPQFADRLNAARTREGMKPCESLQYEFDAFDWLASKGFAIKTWQGQGEEYRNYPTLVVTLYAHFALAELNMVFRGSLKKTVKQLQRKGKITQQRRLMASGATRFQDYVELGHLVKLTHQDPKYRRYNNQTYKLAIRFVDTGAIHGMAGYADIAKNVGHELKYKDNFTKEEKSRMLDMALERPKDFEEYALGDLDVYEILQKYDKLMHEIYEQLGVSDYYREPQLTIGGTVKNLFEAKLAQRLGVRATDPEGHKVDWYVKFKEISDQFFKPVSPQVLAAFASQTKALLAKVQGGRCRNARQLVDRIDALICDIDISGCYGEGQRNQIYPIGTPLIWSFKSDSKNNHYPTLWEWMKWNGVKYSERSGIKDWGELINGAWMARISTFEPLKYPQDLFESWTTPNREYKANLLAKFVRDSGNDTENQGTDSVNFDVEYGQVKLLNYEIHNAVITHDLLQIILSSAPKQRRDLLKTIRVTASMVYPKSQLIEGKNTADCFEELQYRKDNWTKKNIIIQRYDQDGNPYLIHREQECYGWVAINLGDLLIDELLINRKKAKITDGKKSPKDQLFKLCVNTTYGDMVSKYFQVSNPCVGNNITARARALAWCMEKGFNSLETITDGGGFLPNEVNYNPSLNPKAKKQLAPLGGEGEITAKWVGDTMTLYKGDRQLPKKWIDREAWNHLTSIFPSLDLFSKQTTKLVVTKEKVEREPRQGMFEFEVKDYYNSGAFHGSANYYLVNPNGVTLRARGYESNRKHDSWEWDGDKLVLSNRYNETSPIGDFLSGINTDPTRVPRQQVAVKNGILKVKDYAKHAGKYDELGLEPGDNILKPLLVNEFSISQFTFKTWKQWNSWEKAISRAKDKGKQSIEGFFTNKDGTLNYRAMVAWVFDAIEKDVTNPLQILDKHYNGKRDRKVIHPHAETLAKVRDKLEQPFVRAELNAQNTENWKTTGEQPEIHWEDRKKRRGRKMKYSEAVAYLQSKKPTESTQPQGKRTGRKAKFGRKKA